MRKKKPIDRMPGNAAGRRKLRRYLERHYAALDIEQYHDCMVVKLPKGFKYDLDFLIRRQAGRFTDIDLRALILDNPTVGPTGEDLKAANLVPNPFNTYPAHNFFVQAAAARWRRRSTRSTWFRCARSTAEAMTHHVVDGRQRLRAYAEMDAELSRRFWQGEISRSEHDPNEPPAFTEEEMALLAEPCICTCGRDLGDPPAVDCPVPYVHGDDVYK